MSRPAAQKTDGKMLCKALLLSDMVAMNNKPELEIFADDVACGHGATCGGLNDDQIFYLQARGLPCPEAEALLLEAFGGELVDEIPHEDSSLRSEPRSRLARGATIKASHPRQDGASGWLGRPAARSRS